MDKSKLASEIIELCACAYRLGRGTRLDLDMSPELQPEEAAAKILALTDSYYLGLIGETETVPKDFEKLLPDRQDQMNYKSCMWARNDVRKELRNRIGGCDG